MLHFNRFKLLTCFLFCLLFFGNAAYSQQINTEKPWTFWWWMGNAVNEKDIKYNLINFKNAGVGGVHIIPIYGVKGTDKQFLPFLGTKYMQMVKYTIAEAKKLGLGVDMTTGTGWPFGGPNINEAESAEKWVYNNGQFSGTSTKQLVKRAAPGGAGLVLDPFSASIMKHYLERFDSAFAKGNSGLRGMYQDSYEVYGANWSANFLQEFKKRRGYDLNSVAKIFLDSTDNAEGRLVKMDYQQTLSEMLYDGNKVWTTWSAKHKLITRYQAHGSPGNLLDLYSLASVPETEAFGSSNIPIPGLRVDHDYRDWSSGRPNPLLMKFASSASDLYGKKLTSSETFTWLANHFKVSLSQAKPQADEVFTAGINHIFFHGTTYSPRNDPYPGWLFYASTNFGPSSHFYKQLPLFTKYIQNCQHILQNSKPDNDMLVYFPIQDIWAEQGGKLSTAYQLDAHHTETWLNSHAFGKLCTELKKDGYSFDYASDRVLNNLKVSGGKLVATGSTYKVLVVPACNYMPLTTIERLLQLGKQGATIIFENNLPKEVMGYADHQTKKRAFESTKDQIKTDDNHFVLTSNVEKALNNKSVSQEMIGGEGLSFIRKTQNGRKVYFISNLADQFKEGWVNLTAGDAAHLSGYDPLTGRKFNFAGRTKGGQAQIWLQLLPGQSSFIMQDAAAHLVTAAAPKDYVAFKVDIKWKLQFLEGRPAYHESFNIDTLQSWTNVSDTAKFYTGTACYSASFVAPKSVTDKKDLVIDLGMVNESASVKINGKLIGTAWSIPFQLKIPSGVLVAGKNTIEIVATNLSANYMRVYDKQHPEWKKFYDINIADITYTPFDASRWPIMPSGISTNNLKILCR